MSLREKYRHAQTISQPLLTITTPQKQVQLWQKKTNDRKRQRRESLTTSPITIDLSDLTDKLINHNPIGQNRFGILGVLADIGIDSQEINNLHQNKMVPILRL